MGLLGIAPEPIQNVVLLFAPLDVEVVHVADLPQLAATGGPERRVTSNTVGS